MAIGEKPPVSDSPSDQLPSSDQLTSSGLFTPLRSLFSFSREEDRSKQNKSCDNGLEVKKPTKEKQAETLSIAETMPSAMENKELKDEGEDEDGTYAQGKRKAESEDDEESEWACSRCTFLNYPTFLTCEMCGEIRSGDGRSKGANKNDNRPCSEEADAVATDPSHQGNSSNTIADPYRSCCVPDDKASNTSETAPGGAPEKNSRQGKYIVSDDPFVRKRAVTDLDGVGSMQRAEPQERRTTTETGQIATPTSSPLKNPDLDFASFTERLSSKRIGPLMTGRMTPNRSRRAGKIDAEKYSTADSSLLMRLRSATTPPRMGEKCHSLQAEITSNFLQSAYVSAAQYYCHSY